MKRTLRLACAALIAFTASHCGKSSSDDAPAAKPQPVAKELKLGEAIKYEGQTEANKDTPAPFTHRHDQLYKLTLDSDTKVRLDQQGSFTGCLVGHKAAGPFVTLIREGGSALTTDTVLLGEAALKPTDLKAALTKGDYQILVTTYGDDVCTAGLDFSFAVDNSSPPPPPPPPPPTPPSSTFDKALAGTWTRVDAGNGMEQKFKIVFTEQGLMTLQVWVMDTLAIDFDADISGVAATSPAHFTMTIKTIRPTAGESDMKVGDFNNCIYAIRTGAPNQMDMNCSETNSSFYPLAFDADTETYNSGDFPVAPPPPPLGNAIVRDFPGIHLAIPDASSTGVSLNIPVENTGVVQSINAQFTITHALSDDLIVSLIHPDGTAVVLFSHVHMSTRTFSMNLGAGGTAFTALNSFNGKAVTGTWRLKVADTAGQDIGTLDAVKLTINPQ